MKLNIITPCSRPQNLEAIARSILRGFRKAGLSDFDYWIPPVPVRWWIVFDMNCLDYEQVNKACLSVSNVEYCVVQPTFLFNKKTGEAGHQHRNLVLDILEEKNEKGWVYSVDDDNILHENFYRISDELNNKFDPVTNVTISTDNISAIAVNQVFKNGKPNRSPVNGAPLKANAEHMKVYFVDTAQVVFNLEKIKGMRFDSDKYNADGFFIQNLFEKEGNFVFVDEDLSYYNFLTNT